jgi:membrane protein implicated in regulation of membrane protease activity
MGTWKKVALLNVGCLLGIGVSLFIVPPSTPLWIWATASVVWLAVFNYFLIRRLQKGTGERKVGHTPTIGIWLCVVVLLGELVFRYWHR